MGGEGDRPFIHGELHPRILQVPDSEGVLSLVQEPIAIAYRQRKSHQPSPHRVIPMKIARFAGVLAACAIAAPMSQAAFATPEWQLAQYSAEEQTSIEVYEKTRAAVVTIQVGRGYGSGSIISPNGIVVTNEHVIRNARGGQVEVRTPDGRRYRGRVISVDRPNDLALVQILSRDRFPTISLANPNDIRVGQRVYAIGSPFGLSGTFTTGTLSRIAPNGDLQTDAAINPGNSGGPLLNSRGELIGVNKAILNPTARGNIGIGFATSAVAVRQLVARTSSPPVAQSPPPRLGVSVDRQTLTIQAVQRGSIAARIGLRPGDRLIAVNRQRVRSIEQILTYLDNRPDGMLLTVARGRRLATIAIDF